jgi:epoxyqueuosine reductase
MTPASLTAALKEESLRLGFDQAGAAPAIAPPDFERLERWIADGRVGQMRYFADRLDAYRHPQSVLEGVRSILMLAANYRTVEPIEPNAGQAKVSRYAWGADYHDWARERLHRLADFHRRLSPMAHVRGVVDTAPLMEKTFGRLAGLGWIGKNTLLINPRLGSWFFLAALLTTDVLEYDAPAPADRCGECRRCLDACPTGALAAPYRLDARHCVSYLTTELRGNVPDDLRPGCAGRLFGCDACQDACPWNRCTPPTEEPAFFPKPGMNPANLDELVSLDESDVRRRFRRTPLWRVNRAGILRNALLAKNRENIQHEDTENAEE